MRALLCLTLVLVAAGCSEPEEDGQPTQDTRMLPVGTTTAAGFTVEEAAAGQDPDDVEGPLDLKEVRARRDGDLLHVELETWELWRDDVLESESLLVPGANRLTLFYDVDLDGRIDYRGRFIYSEGVLSLVISGRGQAFEPVPVNRLEANVVSIVHAVDVFFVVLEEAEIESDLDIAVAVRSQFEGVVDRAPDNGWIGVPFT